MRLFGEDVDEFVAVSLLDMFLEKFRPNLLHDNDERLLKSIWGHVQEFDRELSSHVESLFAARREELQNRLKIGDAGSVKYPWQLFEDWVSTLMVGTLREQSTWYIFDQCFLSSWATAFPLLLAVVFTVMKTALLKCSTTSEVESILQMQPKQLYTKDIREYFKLHTMRKLVDPSVPIVSRNNQVDADESVFNEKRLIEDPVYPDSEASDAELEVETGGSPVLATSGHSSSTDHSKDHRHQGKDDRPPSTAAAPAGGETSARSNSAENTPRRGSAAVKPTPRTFNPLKLSEIILSKYPHLAKGVQEEAKWHVPVSPESGEGPTLVDNGKHDDDNASTASASKAVPEGVSYLGEGVDVLVTMLSRFSCGNADEIKGFEADKAAAQHAIYKRTYTFEEVAALDPKEAAAYQKKYKSYEKKLQQLSNARWKKDLERSRKEQKAAAAKAKEARSKAAKAAIEEKKKLAAEEKKKAAEERKQKKK